MIGKTVSHYRILEKLGEGGMGVVYRAEDTRLDRDVAIKFLPSQLASDESAKRRFLSEAKAASALEHPNICHIHEIGELPDGQLFMVMPCYEGETLRGRLERGPLGIDEALQTAIQMGSALSRAHEKGIIHRDIKPGNVMLTDGGTQAKLLDFGLAKKLDATQLTKTGVTVGTVAYMSPEQARGEETDHRTDIWSLGVVLYEMLTVRKPFRGDVEPAVVYSILNQEPEPLGAVRPEVPVGLEDIVERALAKSPDKRFESMAEMLSALDTVREEAQLGVRRRKYRALRRLKRRKTVLAGALAAAVVVAAVVLTSIFSSRSPAIDSLAVLPLLDLSAEEGQGYFADGVTGELITNLTKIKGLERVSPRSAVMRYRETNKTLREIAKELGVRALVAGTIQREGDRVRITAELTDAMKGKLIWSNTFDGKMENILALQSEVARMIVREIRVSLTPEERAHLSQIRDVDPEAYDAYLKGQSIMTEFLTERFDEAVQYYREAIERDPEFARAYAALADVYVWLGMSRGPDDYRESARAAALKALELDEKLPEAHVALGRVRLHLDFDWKGAEEAHRRAAELPPHGLMDGQYLILSGRFDEGIAYFQRRIELDPLDPTGPSELAWAYICSRRFEDAIASYQKSLRLFPGFSQYNIDFSLAQCYGFEGMIEEALATVERLKPAPEASEAAGRADTDYRMRLGTYKYLLAHTYACSGNREEVQKFIDEFKDDPAKTADIAEMYAALGDKEKAMDMLERAWEIEPEDVMWLNGGALFDPLNDYPRYIEFRKRIGIPEIQWSSAPPWSPKASRRPQD